ncbi:MAG: helix-turn-helix transcriptional regulator [Lachnospiraceae bacterium]|jgi:transcriptional regulator with XRE-family HTH domain|nr:helix-turn-helix transcriptional regulator [Lachnospiraceae bacterium]
MIKKALGLACKEYREKLNISQEKFALSIGMDRTYYSSVETGKRNISVQNIKKIADGLDLSVSELFKRTEEILEGIQQGDQADRERSGGKNNVAI